MKKILLLTGLAFTSFVAIHAQEAPNARSETFYTTAKRYEGNLVPLVSGGTQPYNFGSVSSSTHNVTNGILDLQNNGRFALVVSNENQPATFKFHVIDALGFQSNEATVTVEYVESLPAKEKLK